MSQININSEFDGGNISCLDASDPANIRLAIEVDHQSDFYQWFFFRSTGCSGKACTYLLENAAGSAYADGWDDYQAVASYDQIEWFRVPTSYENGVLSIHHTSEFNSIYYAYFAPYSMQQHHEFIGSLLDHPAVDYRCLGQTLDGQTIDQLIIGDLANIDSKKKLWIHGRQHPGETMASWWAEGFLARLLDESDAIAQSLLEKAVFYVSPNINPDGSRRGHLRTNAAGANLNREWLNPTLEKSPEVYLMLEAMKKDGVDFCLDVHGDEALPYNFIAGAEGVANWDSRKAQLQKSFTDRLKLVNPDFQTEKGYPLDEPNSADMSICTNFIAQEFDCLSMTLEMPFKDTIETPHPYEGWSPERCQNLGASCLDAISAVIDKL